MILHIDLETRSPVDLPKKNAYVYFDDPDTDVWCAAWAFGEEEPVLWWPGQPCPPRIVAHVKAGGLVAAWNAAFERLAWRGLLGPRYGWPVPKLEQYRCVMAMSYALALPGKLDKAAPALGLDVVKDSYGKALMQRMSKPKGRTPEGGYLWYDDVDRKKRLGEYCLQDVRTEVAVYKKLLPLREQEQELWFLDQRMNDRGVYIDKALCDAAEQIVEAETGRLNRQIAKVSGGFVSAVSNAGRIIEMCREAGLPTESIAKEELADLLVRDDLPPDIREVLEIRQMGAKTSVAKIGKMLATRQADGRMRGNLQYHGATTGRWAARGAQLQNLPRPTLKVTDAIIADVMTGNAGFLAVLHHNPISVVSDCIRSMVAAEPGNALYSADFSQIEARVTAWLAGQENVVKAFVLNDRKEGPDVYTVAAAGIYGTTPADISKDDPRRQVGKVAVLSLGFGGGALALLKMAKNYRLDLADAREAVLTTASEKNLSRVEDAWKARGAKSGVRKDRWTTAELIKCAWRDANPHIRDYWTECEAAAIAAAKDPGTVHSAGKLKYLRRGYWLFCRLPSGRAIAYAKPQIKLSEMPWKDGNGNPILKETMSFYAESSMSKRWEEQHFYGGLAVQNPVQAIARDIMAEAMVRVEAAGYAPVITIHDEVVAEAKEGFGSEADFVSNMLRPPEWADGLPIAAEAWVGMRFRK